ncbi:hypothetical protein TVAG_179680 [Trichomonas vaginalis G3]|uniref:Uncharacterized protein n=1 Tax=Trichomonas vaginalis (strain ATCC PRA-98 / G3) TaxID=412133 RepID=A2F450_TRIV3|nr:S1-P1 nuclease family [Trichomonas vaginalis G3]EAY00297.1 hypothetical protein TVAG_179680 [Trichomonas vaginalis G3]KAI5490870.1 S1-P1 nuclease family [Trichomonas vaginalis G3]|eukprot:XP_001313226.1 hypothetical protein [Trichomonas vaginalis G3]
MFFLFQLSNCWWGHAHSLIASIAMKDFSSKERKILEKFLEYGQHKRATIEEVAVWQDDLKGAYDLGIMSSWHFTPRPLIKDGYTATLQPVTYNITSYMNSAWNSLTNPATTDPWIIAFHLRSLIHFVADVHTPHHNVGYYSQETPDGDKGGNLYQIICNYGSACMNIHFLWDSACLALPLGNPLIPKYLDEFSENVTKIMKNHQKAKMGDLETIDFMKWSNESYDTVKQYGYSPAIERYGEVTDQYLKTCQSVALNRVSLAGYRLSTVLRQIYNEKKISQFVTISQTREICIWCLDAILILISIVLLVFLLLTRSGKKFSIENKSATLL